jgi:hypothetical protein
LAHDAVIVSDDITMAHDVIIPVCLKIAQQQCSSKQVLMQQLLNLKWTSETNPIMSFQVKLSKFNSGNDTKKLTD